MAPLYNNDEANGRSGDQGQCCILLIALVLHFMLEMYRNTIRNESKILHYPDVAIKFY
jgi:hypothetical protein